MKCLLLFLYISPLLLSSVQSVVLFTLLLTPTKRAYKWIAYAKLDHCVLPIGGNLEEYIILRQLAKNITLKKGHGIINLPTYIVPFSKALGNVSKITDCYMYPHHHREDDEDGGGGEVEVWPLTGVILFLFCCQCLFFLLGQALYYLWQWIKLRNRTLRKRQLQELTIRYVRLTEDTLPAEICVICLDNYEEGSRLRQLPCSHEFHQECIDPWLLNSSRLCPICKSDAGRHPPLDQNFT